MCVIITQCILILERQFFMKIIVFSDSHNDVMTMFDMAKKEAPDAVMHLGDHYGDALALKEMLSGIPLYCVPGNTDKESADKYEEIVELCGKRILLTHGHVQDTSGDRNGIRNLFIYGAQEKGADIILFGHTHEPFLHWCNGVWIMNPGRIGRKSLKKYISGTYGVMHLEDGLVKWSLCEV